MLKCVDCGAEFEFPARDAAFYKEKGWEPPRRCKTCRAKRKPAAGPYSPHDHNGDTEKEHTPAIPQAPVKFKVHCSVCGIETMVPFKPNPNRPTYCRSCFTKVRRN